MTVHAFPVHTLSATARHAVLEMMKQCYEDHKYRPRCLDCFASGENLDTPTPPYLSEMYDVEVPGCDHSRISNPDNHDCSGVEVIEVLDFQTFDSPNQWGDSFWAEFRYNVAGNLATYGFDGIDACCYMD